MPPDYIFNSLEKAQCALKNHGIITPMNSDNSILTIRAPTLSIPPH